MADNADDPMTIASSFLLQSPPGEINDVLSGAPMPLRNRMLIEEAYIHVGLSSDVRNIIADDAELEKGIAAALEEYNLSQFTTVDVPGHQHKIIICDHGRLPSDDLAEGSGRFVDPRTKTSFVFNHADLVRPVY